MSPMDASIALQATGNTQAPAAPLPEPILTAQTIIAMAGILMVAGTIIAVFLKGDAATQQLVVGFVMGTFGSSVFQFYFGSSRGSQRKDDAKFAQDAKTTTATTTVP
jgi:hypothetical protein